MIAICVEALQKNYGKSIGTKDVTFSIEEGEIFGFVGPNGAGKSTTLRVLMNLVFPTGGQASIRGLDVTEHSKQIKRFTGYVPSDVRLYSDLRVGELLRLNARFYREDCGEEGRRLCTLFEVDKGKKFRELSTGNKKKVSMICALMFSPTVIILDEPTSGLDPVMQKRLFEELRQRADQGAAILLSSHNLAEVQEYCTRVAFIKSGRVLAIKDLTSNAVSQNIITVSGGDSMIPDAFTLVSEGGGQRVFRSALDGEELLKALVALNPSVFSVAKESMEEYFWNLFEQEKK